MQAKPSPSRPAPLMNSHDPPPRPPRADWTAWGLHFVFGFVVGGCGGYLIWGQMLRMGFSDFDGWPGFILSTALFVGAITSRHGDRVWWGRSVFDPEPHRQSPASKAASTLIGSYGVLLFCLTGFRHLPQTRGSAGFSGGDVASLVIAAFIACLVIVALRTDTLFGRRESITREESPLLFWLHVAAGSVGVFYLVIDAFR